MKWQKIKKAIKSLFGFVSEISLLLTGQTERDQVEGCGHGDS